jgi:hypothetical protein
MINVVLQTNRGGDVICLQVESINTLLIIGINRAGRYRCAAVDVYTGGAWIKSGPG